MGLCATPGVEWPRCWRYGSVCTLLAAAFIFSTGPVSADVDLRGDWYVLIHYRDSNTANPDADRWEDKVWTFAEKGSRLEWTEYPIVFFSDGSGRFGRVGGNPRARILHAWEPNASQQSEIDFGLQVNSRGSKTKSLRGSMDRGYASTRARGSRSATVVSYEESWAIDDPTGKPVFTRDDIMGTGLAVAVDSEDGTLSGRTRYATTEVSADGRTLSGTYTRDESKQGVFRLVRAGAPRGIESDGRTPNEKAWERAEQNLRQELQQEAIMDAIADSDPQVLELAREALGEEKLAAIVEKYGSRLAARDPSAVAELRAEVRREYFAVVREDVRTRLSSDEHMGLPELSSGEGALPQDRRAALADLREKLGEDRLSALDAEYRPRIEAGDSDAAAELRAAVEEAYAEAVVADFMKRLDAGDADAIREAREYRRRQLDRRD